MLGVFTRFYFVHKKHMVLLPAQGALEKPVSKNNEDHIKKFMITYVLSQQKYFIYRFPFGTNRLMCMRT